MPSTLNMKRCTSCNRTYTDLSLNFCLEDGSPLVNDPAPTSGSGSAGDYSSSSGRDLPPTVAFQPPAHQQNAPLRNQPDVPANGGMKNRNKKIALGCGSGCLGIILIVVAFLVLASTGYLEMPGLTSYTNTNSKSNRDSNSNSPYNRNSNTNTNTSSSSSTMSEDAKHRLYQAAGMTSDSELILRVIRKIGLGDGTGSDHQEFTKGHYAWAMNNLEFVKSVSTPEKARAYVEEHIND